jgi:hypothetical protein
VRRRASSRGALASTLASLLVLAASDALAGDPRSFFGGRLRLGGEASATLAPEDEGYFNYSDYETSTLRLFRLELLAEARLSRSVAILFDARSDNLAAPRVYALYLRVRPLAGRELDLQAGLVPPVFGAFARRRYAYDNPLPSLPLAYQYLTTLREDALPENAEQVVVQRGRGWRVRYPIGDSIPGPGLPLVNAERWDTGLQLRLGARPLSLAVAVTQGTLSHPELEDQNGGKQVAARLAFTPRPALVLGLSGASGEFVARAALAELPSGDGGVHRQQALGVDLEWSAGHWILRSEAVWSRFSLPAVAETRIEEPLSALGLFVEARYKLRPGLYLASRVERLAMGEIASGFGSGGWDAPVTRVELGAGWSLHRHLLVKGSWQHNRREGGRVRENHLVAGQVLLWF